MERLVNHQERGEIFTKGNKERGWAKSSLVNVKAEVQSQHKI